MKVTWELLVHFIYSFFKWLVVGVLLLLPLAQFIGLRELFVKLFV